jgi:hypothetical protein
MDVFKPHILSRCYGVSAWQHVLAGLIQELSPAKSQGAAGTSHRRENGIPSEPHQEPFSSGAARDKVQAYRSKDAEPLASPELAVQKSKGSVLSKRSTTNHVVRATVFPYRYPCFLP